MPMAHMTERGSRLSLAGRLDRAVIDVEPTTDELYDRSTLVAAATTLRQWARYYDEAVERLDRAALDDHPSLFDDVIVDVDTRGRL